METSDTGIDPMPNEFYSLQARFGFLPKHGAQYPPRGVHLSHSSEGKVGVTIPTFDVGLQLPTIEFFDEIMSQYGFSIDDMTPNVINKIVGFEMACRTLGVVPQFWDFKYFFNSSTQSSVHMFSL